MDNSSFTSVMLLILVSLPLLGFCLENTNLNYVHDGDATIKSAVQRAPKDSKEPLPAYIYKPIPNHKFKYSNFKYPIATSTQEPLRSFEYVVNTPLQVDEPPPPLPAPAQQQFIPTPYFLPYFTNDMPLYAGYRMLMNNQASIPSLVDYLGAAKESNNPRYADYVGLEKLLAKIAVEKVAKRKEDV
ncbi:hypothetical protein NECAME_09199 [Necator americanus]|uniref:Uncharacterized protein n=1 Tax=Necator americanus TaxID=51031 RepID=W2TFP1_NECAM|nr:hypothetical protein NECAME_09199 [Necator americanus]ETN80409.1 hypothetical protein NECAME_09199 [Necator americanus]